MNRSWKVRVLLAAARLGRDFRPAELGVPSLATTCEAVSMLVQNGFLEWLRGDGSCQWTYRLTPAGKSKAAFHASNDRPRRKSQSD